MFKSIGMSRQSDTLLNELKEDMNERFMHQVKFLIVFYICYFVICFGPFLCFQQFLDFVSKLRLIFPAAALVRCDQERRTKRKMKRRMHRMRMKINIMRQRDEE